MDSSAFLDAVHCNDPIGSDYCQTCSSDIESGIELNDGSDLGCNNKALHLARLKPGNLAKRVFAREIGYNTRSSKNPRNMSDVGYVFDKMEVMSRSRICMFGNSYSKALVREQNKGVFALIASRIHLNPYDVLRSALNENDISKVKFIMEELSTLRDKEGKLYTPDTNLVSEVLRNGSFESLKYFMEELKVLSGDVSVTDVFVLTRYGSLEMVKLAMEGSSRTGPLILGFENNEVCKCTYAWAMLKGAALQGNMAMMKYLVEDQGLGKYVDRDIESTAEEEGYKDMARYLNAKRSGKVIGG